MGFVYLHACLDDNSRYAYVEQHRDERADTSAAFMRRAFEHFKELGLDPPEAVMSDNGNAYRSGVFRAELQRVGARQILTPPYTPRWNGKIERFFQTLKREWAYAHSWCTSAHRSRAMASYVRYYNRRRPHSSLGDRPPISRVHNVHGQDT
jgi:transposase InsO family protein